MRAATNVSTWESGATPAPSGSRGTGRGRHRRAERAHRLQDLRPARRASIRCQRPAGRLHRQQPDHLQHVILEHVADGAGLLVEPAAPSDAERLGHGDLHAFDVVAVPDRFEERVRESEQQQVLHRLLAEVVVDPEDLVSSNTVCSVALSSRADSRSRPNGFSMMTRPSRGAPGRVRAPRRSLRTGSAEWRDSGAAGRLPELPGSVW